MIVNVKMTKDVATYYADVDLSQVADFLLTRYDFTNLPPMTDGLKVQRQVLITDPTYLALYNTLGPQSKKVSLGRLFELGFNVDILAELPQPEVTEVTDVTEHKVNLYLKRAYENLGRALTHVPEDDNNHRLITVCRNVIKEVIDNGL